MTCRTSGTTGICEPFPAQMKADLFGSPACGEGNRFLGPGRHGINKVLIKTDKNC